MRLFQTQEFAEMAGVTVRTLHHYDRLSLLQPTGRSEAGYRFYSARDLVRLEEIQVFKLLGLPLKQIRELLTRSPADLTATLLLQRRALIEKRRQLDVTLQALSEAERELQPGHEPDSDVFKKILQVIEMQNNTDWGSKYFSDEAKAKIEDRKNLWSPELQQQLTAQWEALVQDVEAAIHEDPASERVQALAGRWSELLRGFTGGDPEIQKGLNGMYADQANWPTEAKKHSPVSGQAQAFIIKAMQARKKPDQSGS